MTELALLLVNFFADCHFDSSSQVRRLAGNNDAIACSDLLAGLGLPPADSRANDVQRERDAKARRDEEAAAADEAARREAGAAAWKSLAYGSKQGPQVRP